MTTTAATVARGAISSGHAMAARVPEKPRVAFKALLLGQKRAPEAKPARERPLGRPATHEHASQKGDHPPRERAPEHGHEEPAKRRARKVEDALDPAARQAAQIAPPLVASAAAPPVQSAPEVKARASLEELLPQVVKRIAWAGDARKGSVRMELGAGALAGGTVIVHAEEGRVRVEMTVPAGSDAASWQRRIEERLRARGIEVEAIEVR
jgi:hypothetical protein